MALASAMQTALSGLAAAETAVSVLANNLANAQTAGFKASSLDFATQQPQSQGLGSAPDALHGGGNPLQIGRGVQVAGIATDPSPGPPAANGDAEQSNTDIARNIIELNLASNYFLANLQPIDTAANLLDQLVQLGRSRS